MSASGGAGHRRSTQRRSRAGLVSTPSRRSDRCCEVQRHFGAHHTCLVLGLALATALHIAAVAAIGQQSPREHETMPLSGTVLDPEGNGVMGAQVRLFGPNRVLRGQTVTDPAGRFGFVGLHPGTYELRVTAGPLRDQDQIVELRSPSAYLTVVLQDAVLEERVTVTASRGILQDQSRVAANVHTLGVGELQQRAPDLLPQMLSEEPGVMAQQTTPGQGSPILRGQSAQSVLYLLDGIRFNNSTYRGGNTQYLGWIPPVALDAVEILLGPAGVNYGSDALGGAINVISAPTPAHSASGIRLGGSLRAFGQSASLGLGSDAMLSLASERVAGFLAINASRHQDLRSGGGRDSHGTLRRYLGLSDPQIHDILGSRLRDTAYDQAGITAKLNWRWGGGTSLTAFLIRSSQFNVRRYDRLLGGEGWLRAEFTPQRLQFGYLRYQTIFGSTFFETTLSLNQQIDGRRDQPRSSSPLITERNSTTALGYEALAAFSLGNHLVTTGAEVYDEYIDATRTSTRPDGVHRAVRPRFPNAARYTSVGFFILEEWSTLADRLQISSGMRFSGFRFAARAKHNTIDGLSVVADATETFSDLTFNVGATLSLSDATSVYGRVARGFRAPSVFDLGEQGLTGGGFEVSPEEAVQLGALIGDAAGVAAVSTGEHWTPLRPEVLWSFEGGIRWQDNGWQAELTGFDSETHDALSRRAIIVTEPLLGGTVGGQTIVGQDASGRIFVASDNRPVVSRANIGRSRIWGLEASLQRALGSSWRTLLKASLQRGEELHRGHPARKIAPDNLIASVRWLAPGRRLWIEGHVRAARPQRRLNPFDLTDARIGAFRTAMDIADFFDDAAVRLGLVEDGILTLTGETLQQVQTRVLGPHLDGAPLFTHTPGFVDVGVRGAYRLGDREQLLFALGNILDANYRIHGSGFDAQGINLVLSYLRSF